MGAQLVMYHGYKAVYFSGYSFAIGHLGTTDMDLYSGPEIADGARRTVSALRKFQLTQAVGDPSKGIAPNLLEIPPVVVDMDAGYGNIFNVQRQTELLVTAGVAAAHLEDQVLPKRCGHIGGKALVPALEMVGKLRMMRAVADDLGREDFTIIARTDGLSAIDAPEPARGLELAIERACRYLDTGIPDLVWCEFPTSDREPVETFAAEVRKRFPEARFAFNWSSSFKWFLDTDPLTFAQLGDLGFKFIFITSAASTRQVTASPRSCPRWPSARSRATSSCSAASSRPSPTSRPAPTTSSAAFPGTMSWARPTTRRGWVASSPRTCPRTRSSRKRPARRSMPAASPSGRLALLLPVLRLAGHLLSSLSLIPVRVFLPSRFRCSSAPMNLRCFSVLAGMCHLRSLDRAPARITSALPGTVAG